VLTLVRSVYVSVSLSGGIGSDEQVLATVRDQRSGFGAGVVTCESSDRGHG
jgi:hypothetical protein